MALACGMPPLVQRPASFAFSCDANAVFRDVRWESWGGVTARGTGTLALVAGCIPNCDSAPRYHYSVRVVASEITHCGSRRVYGLITARLATPDFRGQRVLTSRLVNDPTMGCGSPVSATGPTAAKHPGFLGVVGLTVTTQSTGFGLPRSGVAVLRVIGGDAFDVAGIPVTPVSLLTDPTINGTKFTGLVIQAINGSTVGSAEQLDRMISAYSPGDTVTVTVYRVIAGSGRVEDYQVTLGVRPPQAGPAPAFATDPTAGICRGEASCGGRDNDPRDGECGVPGLVLCAVPKNP